MSVAEIIEREHLARRAPVPVAYRMFDASWSEFPSNVLLAGVGAIFRSGIHYGMRKVEFRMSDGSLVIVRRKP